MKNLQNMSAAELAATYAEGCAALRKSRETCDELRRANPCGPGCSRSRFESWKERHTAAHAAHRRAALIAAYWREIVSDRLSRDLREAYAATLPQFVGKQAGEKTRAKLYAAISERLKAAGHANRDANGADALPYVYISGRGSDRLAARADGVEVELYGKAPDVERYREYVAATNAITDAVPGYCPLDLSKFTGADDFADTFERATAELERLRREYNDRIDALRTRATWGDCRPGCSRATSDSSEEGIG